MKIYNVSKVLNSRLLYLAVAILKAIKGYRQAIAQLCHLAILLNNELKLNFKQHI
jgi:hypothetical protein